jgi:[acyl-carrier-protein] S-malonyltransferase
MGRDLAERYPAARAVFAAVDEALGAPLSRIMWDGPEDELTATQNAQPAILAHTCAVLAVVQDRLQPTVAMGHSLGEYSAWVAAGALGATDAARLVRRRGELMQEAGARRAGAMAAILMLDAAKVQAACRAASVEGEVAVAANLNSPDQTVISGDPAAVQRAGELCRAEGAKRVVALKVSGAFHSPLMQPARTGLEAALAEAVFATPRLPVIANATAAPVRDPAEALRLLGEQLTAPVRWVESVRRAAAEAPGATFIEAGPGAVLAGLVKKILPDAVTLPLGTADEVGAFLDGAAR